MKSTTCISALLAGILAMVSVRVVRAQTDPAVSCLALAEQRLPGTTISVTQTITTGSFTPPGSATAITNLPPLCRVAGLIQPTSESNIRFEVWLPLRNWNGKFAGVGNGGWAGTISYGALAEQLRRSYASASTNTGHEAAPGVNAARFAFEHPDQLIDFAFRAHHETTLKGKALLRAFYGKDPEHSYWIGCSSGGYEGLMEAQRFPADYDGIVAGAPGMAHCDGGPGPNSFDMQAALEQWVERGTAPEAIIASHSINSLVDRLRPLSPKGCDVQREGRYERRGELRLSRS